MLTKPMKKYIEKEDKRGYNRSQYNSRIKDSAIRSLEDLAYLAKKLPEERLSEIFNRNTLMLFFRAMFTMDLSGTQEYVIRKRERLLSICYELLTYLGYTENAWKLAPVGMSIVLEAPIARNSAINGLMAIFYEAKTRHPTSNSQGNRKSTHVTSGGSNV